jgi:CHAT domain-containing protein
VAGLLRKEAEAAHIRTCQSPTKPAELAAIPLRRSVQNFDALFRGFGVEIEQVRQQISLPGTADELCEVGRRLGVPLGDIILGSNATKSALKEWSEIGRLADYAIVHFATHGALTGQLKGWARTGPDPDATTQGHQRPSTVQYGWGLCR